MITGYSLPDYLNPDFMRGYIEGYEAAKVDVHKALEKMKAVSDCTGTAEVALQGDTE